MEIFVLYHDWYRDINAFSFLTVILLFIIIMKVVDTDIV